MKKIDINQKPDRADMFHIETDAGIERTQSLQNEEFVWSLEIYKMSQCPLKAAKAKLIEKQNLLKKAEEDVKLVLKKAEDEVKLAGKEYRRHLYLNPMNFFPRFQHFIDGFNEVSSLLILYK